METQTKKGAGAQDFFINLGAIVALYTIVGSLLHLLFTVIDTAFPPVLQYYNYMTSASISWPVATLIVFSPIFILLMWVMGKSYDAEPEKKNMGIHRWLTYITLFITGLAMAIDLITVLYYFLDGQNLTTGFILKVLAVLVVAFGVFAYYLSDVRNKLTAKSRQMWRIVALVIILGSIIWGFSVLGSPRTQSLYKYDEQKVNDLMNIQSTVSSYYYSNRALPETISQINDEYYASLKDPQSGQPYEYVKTGDTTYNLCAEFNKTSKEDGVANSYARPISGGYPSWNHPAGHHCFEQKVTPTTVKPFAEPY